MVKFDSWEIWEIPELNGASSLLAGTIINTVGFFKLAMLDYRRVL
jgi:hypothetical protein